MIRVRFAPSPTGHLHIGGLRTALFNWLFARRFGGAFLLRIEDTDVQRSTQAFTDSIISSLQWANLAADEPIVIQSQRIHEHRRLAEQLVEQGKAYRCFCERGNPVMVSSASARIEPRSSDLDVLRYASQSDATQDERIGQKYDRACRDRTPEISDLSKPHAIRFKIPLSGTVTFDDLIRGPISFDIDQLDDFIIMRSDGTPMYNFVVVVDDAFMRITHIIRGEDHIPNTPKQILLYQAFGYAIPAFAHLPMILGPTGARLSKRDGATAVSDYRAQGFLADALCNYLVRLGWSHGDQEIFSREQMTHLFSLDQVNKKGAIFNQEKLLWVNAVYIRQTDDAQLLKYILDDVDPAFATKIPWTELTLLSLVAVYKQRAQTVKELADEIIHCAQDPEQYELQAVEKWVTQATVKHIEQVLELLRSDHDWSIETLTALIKTVVEKEQVKFVAIAQPLRLALIGKSAGPGVYELLHLLGKSVALARIEKFVGFIKSKK